MSDLRDDLGGTRPGVLLCPHGRSMRGPADAPPCCRLDPPTATGNVATACEECCRLYGHSEGCSRAPRPDEGRAVVERLRKGLDGWGPPRTASALLAYVDRLVASEEEAQIHALFSQEKATKAEHERDSLKAHAKALEAQLAKCQAAVREGNKRVVASERERDAALEEQRRLRADLVKTDDELCAALERLREARSALHAISLAPCHYQVLDRATCPTEDGLRCSRCLAAHALAQAGGRVEPHEEPEGGPDGEERIA